MERSFKEISDECRRLVRELVDCLIELETNGAEFPVEAQGRRFRVNVDELDESGEPL